MTAAAFVTGCYSCEQGAQATRPPRDDVVHTEHWRVAHAFNSTLPGWLVLLPTRHLTSFTELTPEAADELGGLVRRLGIALEAVTGCVKTYLMQTRRSGSPRPSATPSRWPSAPRSPSSTSWGVRPAGPSSASRS